MSTFDRRPFLQTRRKLRDLVSIPVMAWMTFAPARRTLAAYEPLTDIPMDLASCGFQVTVCYADGCWTIEAVKDIVPGSTLHLHGRARSYCAALFQIAQHAETAVSDLERTALAAWTHHERQEVAA